MSKDEFRLDLLVEKILCSSNEIWLIVFLFESVEAANFVVKASRLFFSKKKKENLLREKWRSAERERESEKCLLFVFSNKSKKKKRNI